MVATASGLLIPETPKVYSFMPGLWKKKRLVAMVRTAAMYPWAPEQYHNYYADQVELGDLVGITPRGTVSNRIHGIDNPIIVGTVVRIEQVDA